MGDADRLALRYIEEGAFGDTPDGSLVAVATVAVDDTDNSYNDAVEDLSVFKANQTILVSGFTETANNGYKTVVSATANKLVVEEVLTTEALGDTVSILTAYKELRFVSESLGQDTDSQESNEIRDDRQIKDVKRTGLRGSGDIGFELSFDNLDDMLVALLESAGWSTEVSDTQITFSVAIGDNSINDSGSGFVAAGFVANQWIKTSGFTESENNGFFKIVSVVAGKMVLSGRTVATEAAGDTVTIQMSAQALNGVTEHSYSFEKEYTDVSADKFELNKGFELNQMSLEVNAEAIITGTLSFMGKSSASATASTGTGTPKPAPAYGVMSAVDDAESILEAQAEVDMVTLGLTIVNNLRNRPVISEAGPDSIGHGRIGVTGSFTMYFETKTIMDKYLNQTSSSLVLVLKDGDGNAYLLEFPEIKYTSGRRIAGGPNTDIVADMEFSAYMDATEEITVRIAKF